MQDNFNIILGKKIRESRKERKISLNKLAVAMQVSYQQLQKYETGTNRISAEKLFQVSNMLRMKVERFFPDYEQPESGKLSPEDRIEKALASMHDEDRKRYIAEIVEKVAEL